MLYDLSPGDVVRLGDTVMLTVLAVEKDRILVGLESPEDDPGAVTLAVLAVEEDRIHVGLESLEDCPGTGCDCEGADPKPQPTGWERS